MSKYKLKRREFIWKASQLTLALSVIGRESQLASNSVVKAAETKKVAAITNAQLNPEQVSMIRSITSIIIPTDENPGAKEAGIAEYIAQVLQFQGAEAIEQTQQVLSSIDMYASKQFGKPYNQLSETQQKQIADWLASDQQLAPFWTQLRTLTVLRFYSLPMGYKPVGLPGPTIDKGGIPNVNC